MILSKPDILKYLAEGRLGFDPAINPETQVKQCSIDLHLGINFAVFKDPPGFITAIQEDKSLWESEDLWQRHNDVEEFMLQPRGFVLAQTLETVLIPPDLVGLIEGRSSWARMGVSIHVTSPKIDPGFNAQITLEMTNLSPVPVRLRAGIDQPAQLMLVRLSTPLPKDQVYGESADDRFQGQAKPIPERLQPARKTR